MPVVNTRPVPSLPRTPPLNPAWAELEYRSLLPRAPSGMGKAAGHALVADSSNRAPAALGTPAAHAPAAVAVAASYLSNRAPACFRGVKTASACCKLHVHTSIHMQEMQRWVSKCVEDRAQRNDLYTRTYMEPHTRICPITHAHS